MIVFPGEALDGMDIAAFFLGVDVKKTSGFCPL
jgi:hypothetical protein